MGKYVLRTVIYEIDPEEGEIFVEDQFIDQDDDIEVLRSYGERAAWNASKRFIWHK